MGLRKTWREDLIRKVRAWSGNPMQDYPFYAQGREDIIFVHIPKTAGTSMRQSFNLNRTRGYLGDLYFTKHITAREIKAYLGAERYDTATSFAFVRNPWERFYSWYRFLYRKNRDNMADRKMSFEAFTMDCFSGGEYRYGGGERFLESQFYWISDKKGNQIVDFVGRFEHLDADFKRIQKELGVNGVLAERNRAEPVDYRLAYTPALRDLIAENYHADIEHFGYTFEGNE